MRNIDIFVNHNRNNSPSITESQSIYIFLRFIYFRITVPASINIILNNSSLFFARRIDGCEFGLLDQIEQVLSGRWHGRSELATLSIREGGNIHRAWSIEHWIPDALGGRIHHGRFENELGQLEARSSTEKIEPQIKLDGTKVSNAHPLFLAIEILGCDDWRSMQTRLHVDGHTGICSAEI